MEKPATNLRQDKSDHQKSFPKIPKARIVKLNNKQLCIKQRIYRKIMLGNNSERNLAQHYRNLYSYGEHERGQKRDSFQKDSGSEHHLRALKI